MMMIHQPWAGLAGNAKEFRDMAERLDKIGSQIIDIYKEKTGLDE
jgi:ATP-dependent protease ClpP protease subunit